MVAPRPKPWHDLAERHLAYGATVAQTARCCGVSLRTVFAWLADRKKAGDPVPRSRRISGDRPT